MASARYETKYTGKATLAMALLAVMSWRIPFTGALTTAEQQEILDIHNSLRRGEGSSNMNILTWNPTLAIIAQNWTDKCLWQHGQGINSSTLGALNIGQNNYYATGPLISLTNGVNAWFGEKVDYAYSSNTCASGRVCGHYTQVVWADTYEIGCGYTVCPVLQGVSGTNWAFLVCNYGPAGNIVGKRPYLQGPACSQCSSGRFYCNNGLCDRSCSTSGANCVCAAACKNCATVTSDCRCQCGVGWNGVDCSAVCNDTNAYCNPAPGVAGWPPSWCIPTYPYVLDACPKMCGLCVAGAPSVCATSTLPMSTAAATTATTETTAGATTAAATTAATTKTTVAATTQTTMKTTAKATTAAATTTATTKTTAKATTAAPKTPTTTKTTAKATTAPTIGTSKKRRATTVKASTAAATKAPKRTTATARQTTKTSRRRRATTLLSG